MPTSRLLSNAEVSRQLIDLAGWTGNAATVQRTFQVATFLDGIALVNAVAADAEELDHHPDINVRWLSVTFTLSTHSVGGVSQLDIELAHRIQNIAHDLGAV